MIDLFVIKIREAVYLQNLINKPARRNLLKEYLFQFLSPGLCRYKHTNPDDCR